MFRSHLMHNVLIVDEEEHLLSALEESLFPDRDDIAILTASDGEQGLEHLKNSRIDLLISDIKMPGKIDGFQLILRAKEVAPDARVIIITAFGSNRVQNFAAKIGITHYIEKPFNTSELRDAILEILDEKKGFQGVLSDLELTDIIQMLCLARRTALLHLKHRDHRGRIVFDNGDVVHAEFDDLVGQDAVFKMLALRQGDIFMQGDFQNDQRTIEIGWQDLLFEGVRLADEGRADESELEADDVDDDGPGTDVGVGISPSEVDSMIVGAVAAVEDPAGDGFFSEEELREIELANPAIEQSDAELLPFASLAEDSDDAPHLGAELSGEFRSPFRREDSGLRTVADQMTATGTPALIDYDSVAEFDGDRFPFELLKSRLEIFARECPGLLQTAVVWADEGTTLCVVTSEPVLDCESFAARTGQIVRAAQRSIDAMGADKFSEMQVACAQHYVLLRAIEGTPYQHLAVVGRNASLGVALVLMRRLQRALGQDLENR